MTIQLQSQMHRAMALDSLYNNNSEFRGCPQITSSYIGGFWTIYIVNHTTIIFSRESDSTITNVCSFVRLSAKPLNSLKSSSFILHHSSFFIHPSSFIILHSSFIILHSSFIILHSSFLHFATFKLFSLLTSI